MLTPEKRERMSELYLGHLNRYWAGISALRPVWEDGSWRAYWPADEAELVALLNQASQIEIQQVLRDLGVTVDSGLLT